jgi:hypothetical protein
MLTDIADIEIDFLMVTFNTHGKTGGFPDDGA